MASKTKINTLVSRTKRGKLSRSQAGVGESGGASVSQYITTEDTTMSTHVNACAEYGVTTIRMSTVADFNDPDTTRREYIVKLYPDGRLYVIKGSSSLATPSYAAE